MGTFIPRKKKCLITLPRNLSTEQELAEYLESGHERDKVSQTMVLRLSCELPKFVNYLTMTLS